MTLNFFLSLIPILLILYLMVGLRWGASRAGAAGYLAAMGLAIVFFGAGAELLAYAHTKALLLSLDVLMIVWAAYLHFRVADEAGAIKTIGQMLPQLTQDKGMLALLIGWVFASFLQGAGGFGVPVAVVAPVLVGLGFSPLAAVVIPAVGHSWAVTFGSLGSSFQALMAATNLPGELLDGPAALVLGLSGVLVGYMVAHAAGGWKAVRRLWAPVLFIGFVMGAVQYGVAEAGLWNIAAFAGGGVGLLVTIPLANWMSREKTKNMDGRALLIASSSYLILLVVTLGVLLIPGLKDWMGQIAIRVAFPELRTAQGYVTLAQTGRVIRVFAHTGTLLFYAAMLSFVVYRRAGHYKPGAMKRILTQTVQKMMSSSVGITAMVAMAVVMAHAGMTDALARGLANGVGVAFPLVSPWIGALGAFMTGSNTNSNVVFADLQYRTAELLGYSVAWILAAQTAGGAIGSVIAPTKVIVGASTAGMEGREGEVIAKMAGYVALLILFVMLVVLVAIR